MKRGEELPPFAAEYLAATPVSGKIVRWFHHWLKRTGRPLLQLQAAEVEQFLIALVPQKTARASDSHRRRLVRYLEWFHARKALAFDPQCLLPRSRSELPPSAVRFAKTLEPTMKQATVGSHRSALRGFHSWLDSQPLTLETFDRNHASLWLQSLLARGLQAVSRVHIIQSVRAYFRWLEEQHEYAGQPSDHLFRRADFPKLPRYLPRPIPTDIDRVLQRRFRKSKCRLQFGLLLMRRTGLRIGELRGLAFHCVREDPQGNTFLKVPLGKLATERLVPLDRTTLRLVQKIRIHGSIGKAGKRRTLLLERAAGGSIRYVDFTKALGRAAKGLVFAEPLTSHRLRHTYATSMLAGGMSVPSLMKLLGHVDYRMTLRYAAITDETVVVEHAAATQRIEQRYALKPSATDAPNSLPPRTLADLARLVLKHIDDHGGNKQQAHVLIRRIRRLDAAVQRLLRGRSRRPT